MAKFLIIQTAFIGDVILSTPVVEKLKKEFPGCRIDFLLRKGNEGLFENHPLISKIYIWNKKEKKYAGMFSLLKEIRKEKYDYAINLQRFFTTGIFTAFSGAAVKIGFNKNPLSFCFNKRYKHVIDPSKGEIHEVDRNLTLISGIVRNGGRQMPRLYPSKNDYELVPGTPYITISPTSVWFTKQYPAKYWIEMIRRVPSPYSVYLLGGKGDAEACQAIVDESGRDNVGNMAGKLSFLQSAAYMRSAKMNYVNDSAPLHIASAMHAPVTAVFCSTTPGFGFGPLRDNSRIAEVDPSPSCKPCGLHGYKACPLGHFKCADIDPLYVLGEI
ncbi:MAG TPA: glycosyltransferase family 9 protein [Bacteroidales bacterium]|nr:glycosyltransferase family 9 protein [Bacteroidales bacterium]